MSASSNDSLLIVLLNGKADLAASKEVYTNQTEG